MPSIIYRSTDYNNIQVWGEWQPYQNTFISNDGSVPTNNGLGFSETNFAPSLSLFFKKLAYPKVVEWSGTVTDVDFTPEMSSPFIDDASLIYFSTVKKSFYVLKDGKYYNSWGGELALYLFKDPSDMKLTKNIFKGLDESVWIAVSEDSIQRIDIKNAGTITIDNELNENSTNPVQNAVITKGIEAANEFYPIPGDITTLIQGESEEAIDKVREVIGTIDGWTLNTIKKKYLIDKNGLTASFYSSSVGSGNYQYYISYYNGILVNVELFARQISTSGPPTLNIEKVTINKNSNIIWSDSTNANNIKNAGIYFIDGVHSNSGDNLPTVAYANGYIGGIMSVTVSTKDEALNEQIIGQNLTLSNKVSGETKQYIRSCIIKNEVETWSAWKEVNTIQMFGEKSSGIATRADINATIDNGQYAGVYMDADGFLPQGATFTLTVINNYAATAASSLPANYRQVTQLFIYTPLSTTGNIIPSKMVKRDGIGEDSIVWGELESISDSPVYQLPGDITAGFTDSNYNEVLGTYPEFKAAYDAGKIFVSKGVYLNVQKIDSGGEHSYSISFSYYYGDGSLRYAYTNVLSYNGTQWDDDPTFDRFSIKGEYV